MALDTNIALGVKPVEQVNMLGQMGQMMQLRQANDEYQSNNALKDFYAQGGDLSKPEDQRRLMSTVGAKGADLIAKQYALQKTKEEVKKLGYDNVESEFKQSRALLSSIDPDSPNAGAQLMAWHEANHRSPIMGSVLAASGIDAASSRAALQASIAKGPAGIRDAIRRSSMGQADYQKELMQTERSVIAAGPGNRQATLAEQEAARKQQELNLVRGILTGGPTPPTAPPVAANAPMGGGGGSGGRLGSGTFNIPMGGAPTGVATQPNVLATQVAPLVTTPPPANALLNPPAGQTGVAPAANRVDQIKQQLTQLAVVGGPVATQAMEGLVKEYNVLNPAGKIEIGQDGVLRTINERSGVATIVTGADGKPVKGNVTPIIKSVLDQTDPAGKRMIDVNVNEYVPGTGLGVDGKGAAPKGVIGISSSHIPPNYMIDPANPQGLIPVPGSAADPNASVPSGYRKTATGFEPIPGGPQDPNAAVPPNYRKKADGSLEFIPGGPADPKVIAATNTVKLSTKDKEAREAKYPQATTALKAFEAKTNKFERDIDELIANEKGLNEITGFFAGRTDLSAMSKEARRAFALFNTITAKGGFSELQDMRNASPTGGALGNVSNQEGRQLIDSFGALTRTQDGNDVRKSLANAKSDLQNLKERMREAYDLTYEYKTQATGGFTYLGKE